MKYTVSSLLLITILLTGCMATSPDETTTEEIATEVSYEITESSTTEESTSTKTTTEETSTTETTEHNPVLTLKQIEYNGVLPDGEYFVMISSFDDNCSGANFSVRGYWRITEEEYNNLQAGDTVVIGKNSYNWTDNGFIEEAYAVKQYNGYWYIRGAEDSIFTYTIAENLHLNFDQGIEVYSDALVYGSEKPSIDWATTTGYESPFKYNNIQEYVRDVKENGGALWGCHIVVEGGVVTKIYANPQLHQPWMKPEIWDKYHSN